MAVSQDILTNTSINIINKTIDLCNMEAIEKAFTELKDENIKIDCCVNNAGLAL